MKRPAAKSVDAYLAALPAPERAALTKLRKTIRSMAPMAVEKISYGIPGYLYGGPLVYFAAFRDHLGLYGCGSLFTRFEKELKGFELKGKSIHFTAKKQLPVALVKELVRARVEQAEMRGIKKRQ